MRTCNECNITFESNRSYSNHVRWNHLHVEYKRTKCQFCNKKIRNENFEKHLATCQYNITFKKNCLTCNKEIFGKDKKFCSCSCSATHNNLKKDYTIVDRSYITPEWKEKQRQNTLKAWKNGIHSIDRKTIYTSKNERAIVKYFRETYPKDEWKTGGRLVLSDGTFLARDLWSDKLKICFEYDGIWHFKDIHGQLNKKQTKDRLLEEWCKDNKYRLIRIDENSYKDIKQIESLIYNQKEQIIKVGDRY
jgi:hypothetical protein